MAARRISVVVLALTAALTFRVGAAQAAEFQWKVVEASGGSFTLVDNDADGIEDQIIFQQPVPPGGVDVTLEIFVSDWGPQLLGSYGARLDEADFSNGIGNDLALATPETDSVFIDYLRPDQVFYGAGIPLCDPYPCAWPYPYIHWNHGLIGGGGAADDGQAYYAGTLILHLPAGAGGTYTIRFVGDPPLIYTYMNDSTGLVITPLTLTPGRITVPSDCNGNGVFDTQDIAAGTSEDCNENGNPDECDTDNGTSEDCNQNIIPDECEGAAGDCNGNGVRDLCDLFDGTSADCNVNGVPDECDVTGETSQDCNYDQIPDECQPDEDCNKNGTRDICDIGTGVSEDCNHNLAPDDCDITAGRSPDDDGNGVPDECEMAIAPRAEPAGPACNVDADCDAAGDRWLGAVCAANTCYVPKNRYLSIDPARNVLPVAYRVTVTEASKKVCSQPLFQQCEADGDCPAGETCEYKYDQSIIGTTWWLEEPVCKDGKGQICPANSPRNHPDPCMVPDDMPISNCSAVDDNGNEWMFGWHSSLGPKNGAPPPARVWTETPLHVGDCVTAPVITYEIAASEDDGQSFGEPLEIGTIRQPNRDWGDLTAGAIGDGPPTHWYPPFGFTNMTDSQGIVAVFEQWASGYVPVCWADLTMDQKADMSDIQQGTFAIEQVPGMETFPVIPSQTAPSACP